MNAELTIVLGLPPRELKPNARPHYMAKSKAVKAYRLEAKVMALKAMGGLPLHYHHFEKGKTFCRFYLPTRHRSDPDNLLASMKSAFDGFVDAGLLVDDKFLTHAPVDQGKSKANPRVEIHLELER